MAVLRGFHVFAVAVAAATLVTGAAASASPGSTERAALADSGAEPDADVLGQVSMTPDGRFVVFLSASPALAAAPAAGTPPFAYLRDRALGRTELVGRGADGSAPVISADGRYVAFASRASDLVGGDTNGASDVFVVDRATGVTTRASVAGTGAQAAGASTS